MIKGVFYILLIFAFLGVSVSTSAVSACGTQCEIMKVSTSENSNCCSKSSIHKEEEGCCKETNEDEDCSDCNCCSHGSFSPTAFAAFTFRLSVESPETKMPQRILPLYHYIFNHIVWQPPQIRG